MHNQAKRMHNQATWNKPKLATDFRMQTPRNFGLLFGDHGSLVLGVAMESSQIRPAGKIFHGKSPDEMWILDCVVKTERDDAILCGTKPNAMRPRKTKVVHLYPPAKRYYENSTHACFTTSAWIGFKCDMKFLYDMCDNKENFAAIHDPGGGIGDKLQAIVKDAAAGGNRNYLRCCSIAHEIMFALFHALPLVGGHPWEYTTSLGDGIQHPLAERVMSFLERRFREHLTMEKIATELGTSKSTLSHSFRSQTGETVMGALRRIRLEQSLPNLRGGMALKEVAPLVGFRDEYYYSRVFRNQFGMPPGEWRRRHIHASDA